MTPMQVAVQWTQAQVIEKLREAVLKRPDPVPLLAFIDLLATGDSRPDPLGEYVGITNYPTPGDNERPGPRGDSRQSEGLREAIESVYDTGWRDHEAGIRPRREEVVARALLAATPEPTLDAERPQTCPTCRGDGWVSGMDADPLPSGEPGEPYQVQETCPDCGGVGTLGGDSQPWTAAGKALVEAIENATPEDLDWMPFGARIAEIEREVAARLHERTEP